MACGGPTIMSEPLLQEEPNPQIVLKPMNEPPARRGVLPIPWRWRVVGLLFLATVLNYLDRQTMAICAPRIKEEFQLTEEGYGQLLSAFRWTYAALLVPAG